MKFEEGSVIRVRWISLDGCNQYILTNKVFLRKFNPLWSRPTTSPSGTWIEDCDIFAVIDDIDAFYTKVISCTAEPRIGWITKDHYLIEEIT